MPLKPIRSLAIDGDGSHIGLEGNLMVGVWSLVTGAKVFSHDLHDEPWLKNWVGDVRQLDNGFVVALSPDSRRLAAYTGTETRIWNTSDGKSVLLKELRGWHLFCPNGSTAMAFSPDGSRLAAGGLVFDANTGKELLKLSNIPYTSLCYSGDGRRILYCSSGGTSLLDALTGKVQFTIQKSAMAAAITPDGKRLLLAGSGSYPSRFVPPSERDQFPDGNFHVWVGDAVTGQEIADIPFPLNGRATQEGGWATISPDGERIGVFSPGHDPWWIKASL